MTCPICGSDLTGDGYTTVRHCENIDVIGDCYEPDSGPVFCESTESQPGQPAQL